MGEPMNYRQLLPYRETLASEATGLLGAVTKTFRETRRSRALTVISLAVIALMICGLLSPCATRAQVINYPNGFAGSTGQIWLENGTVLSGSSTSS